MNERPSSTTKALLTLALLGLFPGCEDLPGENFRGVIEAPEPWTLPTTGRAVCISVIQLDRSYRNTAKSTTSYTYSTPKFAPGAVLVLPDGARLKIEGISDLRGLSHSEEVWTWTRQEGGAPPETLLGRDPAIDRDIGHTQDPSISGGAAVVRVNEQSEDCGSEVVLRGIRKGETLTLVELGDTMGRNALRAFAAFFVALTLCGVAPIAFVIWVLVRRARKKSSEAQ